MKISKAIVFSSLVIVFLASFLMLSSCKKENSKVITTGNSFSIGMTVAAKWMDSNYYLAVIQKVDGNNYDVIYADGATGSVKKEDLRTIPAQISLNVGDKVLAVWAGARFYPGTVEEVTETGATIKWEDGSAPSAAIFGQIIKE